MRRWPARRPLGCNIALALLAITIGFPVTSPKAEEPLSEASLIEALKKKSGTRAVAPADASTAGAEQALIESLRGKSSRAISVEVRNRVAEIAETKPSVDIEITFGFNSATISPEAVPALVTLGKALSDGELKDAVFLIAGHTDGKGTADYNQALSERRAEAVKAFLVAQFKLPEARLIALGYGFERLKNTADPLAGENRRVQVVNLAQ